MNNQLVGTIVGFQRNVNTPDTIKIMVHFEEWNNQPYLGTMLIPFRVNPQLSDEQLSEQFYAGRPVSIIIDVAPRPQETPDSQNDPSTAP